MRLIESNIEVGDEMVLEAQVVPSMFDGSDPNSRVIQSQRSITDLLNTVIPTGATNPIGDISSEVGEQPEFTDVYQISKLNPSADPNLGVKIRFNVDIRNSSEFDDHGQKLIANLIALSEVQGKQREYAAMRISFGDTRLTVYYTSNHPFGCQPDDYERAHEILYNMAKSNPEIASHLATAGGDGSGIIVEHFHTHPPIVGPIQSSGDILAMQVHQQSMMIPRLGENAAWRSHVIPIQNNGNIISTFDPQKNFANQEEFVQMN